MHEWEGPTVKITAIHHDAFTSSLELTYLPFQKFGSVMLDSIRYSFYKNQFFLAKAQSKSPEDIEKLHQAVVLDLGPASDAVKGTHYRWHGQDVDIILSNANGIYTVIHIYKPLF